MVLFTFIFAAGILFISPGLRGGGGIFRPQRLEDTVAKVGKRALLRTDWDSAYAALAMQSQQFGLPTRLEDVLSLRYESFQQLVNQTRQLEAAEARRIRVSRADIHQRIDGLANQQVTQLQSQYPDATQLEKAMLQVMAATGTPREHITPDRFRTWLVQYIQKTEWDIAHNELLVTHLRQENDKAVTVTDEEVRESFDEFDISRVRVAPGNGRSDDQAKQQAEGLLRKLTAEKADFAALAKQSSDDLLTKDDGGRTGFVSRDSLDAAAIKALTAISPGQTTPVVKTRDGYEILQLHSIERKLPADFKDQATKYHDSVLTSKKSNEWTAYLAQLDTQYPLTISDPELLAEKAIEEGKSDEAITQLQAVLNNVATYEDRQPEIIDAAYYAMGQIYEQQSKLDDALKAYAAAVGPVTPGDVYLTLGTLSHKLKKDDDARKYYASAERTGANDQAVREKLYAAYVDLGDQQKAKEQQDWLDADKKRQAAAQAAAQLRTLPTGPVLPPTVTSKPAPGSKEKPKITVNGAPQ